MAASFALALMHNLGVTSMRPPGHEREDGNFRFFDVGPKVSFSDLAASGPISPSDLFHTVLRVRNAEELPPGTKKVLVERQGGSLEAIPLSRFDAAKDQLRYAVYQFSEFEQVEKDQVVAVGVPSGTTLSATFPFKALFVAKSGELYKDPSVVRLPVPSDALYQKFGYPCTDRTVHVDFSRAPSGHKLG
jgi:hypothetical protein